MILAWGHLSAAGVPGVEPFEHVARHAAQRLVECYHRSKRPAWPWFESRMTYANAVLPQALFVAARCWPDGPFLAVAEEAFAFLDAGVTTAADVFWPVGNCDWYSRGEAKALYDQQPVEASTMADAALTAYSLCGDESYLEMFRRCPPLVSWREQQGTAAGRHRERGLLRRADCHWSESQSRERNRRLPFYGPNCSTRMSAARAAKASARPLPPNDSKRISRLHSISGRRNAARIKNAESAH